MEDKQILELYWARSEQAIAETGRKYGAPVRRVALNILRDEQDADECVNDTWLGAWNSMPEHRPDKLGPYLGKLTRWLSLSRRRKQGREKNGGGEAALALEELAECLPGEEDTEREIELRELGRAINRLLGAMRPEERSVFLARYWLCAPIAEIAARHGFTQGKVKTMLRRSRLKLQKQLREEGY